MPLFSDSYGSFRDRTPDLSLVGPVVVAVKLVRNVAGFAGVV